MMNKISVKQEFQVASPCQTCLSVGRTLHPLAQFKNIFQILTSEFLYSANSSPDFVQLCWECIAILKKVLHFQMRAKKAHDILQLNKCYTNKCLSSLRIHALNDNEIIYINDGETQTDIKKIINKAVNKDELHHLDLSHEDFISVDTDDLDVKESQITIKKEKYNNRWAKTRALHNKKPKFNIMPADEGVFRRVQITINEVYSYLERERDSECYKSIRYKCEECVIGFCDEHLLLKHNQKYHNNLGEYSCDICKAKFTSKRHLTEHIVNHYNIYECSLCRSFCRDEKQKRAHLRKHRNILKCLKCKLMFCNRRDFFKHYKDWHERFICEHCGISFKMRYCIKDHIRKQHSPFECKPCKKIFGRYNGLWLHNKLCHSVRGQPAYCVECDKHYVDAYRYRWHLANSVKHKPRQRVSVACPDCDKVFSKKIYMKDHYNLVHLKNFKYRCEECNKNFIRNADLLKHRRRVHEGILPPKNKICYLCGRGFTTNKILTNHMRTHTGERPYECGICPARFAQRTALASHLRSVHRKLRDYR